MDESDFQRKCATLIDRDLYCNVSHLISTLAQDEKYMDDLSPVLSRPDWETAARDAGYDIDCVDEGYRWIKPSQSSNDEDEPLEYDGPYETEAEAWMSACHGNSLDPDYTEAYEHWIVSEWLAEKLEAEGEMVLRDFMNLTIWGRTTTGQSVSMDGVIRRIVRRLQLAA